MRLHSSARSHQQRDLQSGLRSGVRHVPRNTAFFRRSRSNGSDEERSGGSFLACRRKAQPTVAERNPRTPPGLQKAHERSGPFRASAPHASSTHLGFGRMHF